MDTDCRCDSDPDGDIYKSACLMYLCLLKAEKSKKMYIARVICICYNVRRQISVVNMFPYWYGNKKAPFEIVRISLRGLFLGFIVLPD